MATLGEVGEREALRRLLATARSADGVALGPGDDAAVLEPARGCELVATTDAFVEGRHFDPRWIDPHTCGARLAAANLSDLAATAARPRWALLSLGLRREHDLDALLAFQAGISRRLEPFGASIVGGNLTAVEGAEWYDLTLLGEVEAGRAWTRSGARPGDRIAVTGFPGRAAAALRLLAREVRGSEWDLVRRAWLAPEPRVDLARALSGAGAVRAAMDVSDGLGETLAALARASGARAEISALPADPELERAAAALGTEAPRLALGPSDDYELVVAARADLAPACEAMARERGVPWTWIGAFTAGPAGVDAGAIATRKGIDLEGFDAFR